MLKGHVKIGWRSNKYLSYRWLPHTAGYSCSRSYRVGIIGEHCMVPDLSVWGRPDTLQTCPSQVLPCQISLLVKRYRCTCRHKSVRKTGSLALRIPPCRSLKVCNWHRLTGSYEFLLTFPSNNGPTLDCFQGMVRYWLKIFTHVYFMPQQWVVLGTLELCNGTLSKKQE